MAPGKLDIINLVEDLQQEISAGFKQTISGGAAGVSTATAGKHTLFEAGAASQSRSQTLDGLKYVSFVNP